MDLSNRNEISGCLSPVLMMIVCLATMSISCVTNSRSQNSLELYGNYAVSDSINNPQKQQEKSRLQSYLNIRDWDEERRYRVLSFFFDGVPVPESLTIHPADSQATQVEIASSSLEKIGSGQPASAPEEVSIFLHKPYKERRCDICHKSVFGQQLPSKIDLLCRTCHDQFDSLPKYVHGPVVVGQCTTCHNPHSSNFASLLKQDVKTLCTYCHEQFDQNNPQHVASATDKCTDCHRPHYSATSNVYLIDNLTPQ